MIILGINSFFHSSSAALVVDGVVKVAIQEERLTRKKQDESFPVNSIRYCLNHSNISISDVDFIVYYEKPILKFDRIVRSLISNFPKGLNHFRKTMIDWGTNKLLISNTIKQSLKSCLGEEDKFDGKILYSSHHLSHASVGYYSSHFKNAAILVIDAVGEDATTSIFKGEGNNIILKKEYYYPNSIGLLYSSFTQFLGFKVNSGEYKLMGLAAYGEVTSKQTQKFIDLIKSKLIITTSPFFKIDEEYFLFNFGNKMIDVKKFEQLLDVKQRECHSSINQTHCNLAFAIQFVIEEILHQLVDEAKKITNCDQIVISGGVAHNTLAMGKLRRIYGPNKFFVPFAPGDSGTSIGAALAINYLYVDTNIEKRSLLPPFLGTDLPSDKKIAKKLNEYHEIQYRYYLEVDEVLHIVSNLLKEGKVIAWFQGKSEFAERALGNRSILMNPCTPQGKKILNDKIKLRESFRPFAPVIMEEDALFYFKEGNSDFMQYVTEIKEDYRLPLSSKEGFFDKIQTVTSKFGVISHFDYTSRLQTVKKQSNELFWKLICTFKEVSGIPMLVNTSFNLNDEPIVETVEDSVNTFLNSKIDYLIIGNYIINKK